LNEEKNILVISDKAEFQEYLSSDVSFRRWTFHGVETLQKGLDFISAKNIELILLCAGDSPGSVSAQLLEIKDNIAILPPIIVIMSTADVESTVHFMRSGVMDCIVLNPEKADELQSHLEEFFRSGPRGGAYSAELPEILKREKLFRGAVEHSRSAVFFLDRSTGVVLYRNIAARSLQSHAVDELRKICMDSIVRTQGREADEAFRGRDLYVDLGEMTFLRQDGMRRISRVSFLPQDRHILITVGPDNSNYIETQEALTKSLQSTRIINEILKIVNSSVSMEEMFRSVHKSISSIMDTSNFYIALHNVEKGIITFPYFIDQKDDVTAIVTHINAGDSNSITAYIINKRRSVFLNEDALRQLYSAEEGRQLGTMSKVFLGVPLKVREDVIGAIAVQSYDDPNCYTEEHLAFLETLSELIAPAFERMITGHILDEAESTKRKLSTAIEQSPISIVITDRDGKIEYINPFFSEISGYTEEDVLGENPRVLKSGHQEAAFYRELWDTIMAGNIWIGEFQNKARDGRLYWEKATIGPITDSQGNITHFIALKEDITEIREAAEQLNYTHTLYRNAIRNSRGAVYINDHRTGRYEYIDDLIFDFFKIDTDELTPELLRSMIMDVRIADPDYEHLSYGEYREGFVKGAIARYNADVKIELPDGSYRWLFDCALPLEKAENGMIHRSLGILQDITDRVNAEESRKTLEEQLRQSQKLEGIGQLAGGVAHDFNNILTASMGFTELILADAEKDSLSHTAAIQIQQANERARNLVRQLLAFSRKEVYSPVPLQVNVLLRDLNKMLHRLIGEDIEMDMRLQEDEMIVSADPGQLEQIIINLCVNSRDAIRQKDRSQKETPFIHIVTRQVHLTPDERRFADLSEGDFALISVRDNGSGMNPAIIARIFDPFFTTKEVGKGTGLGLSTVYGIIKQNRGAVTVDSVEGQGTEFNIYWPIMGDSSQKTGDSGSSSDVQSLPRGDEHILLVEDDDLVREISAKSLRTLGYTVSESRNGLEALNTVNEPDFYFDLLFSDLTMPKMGGRDLVKELRKEIPDLKVIFCSGYNEELVNRDTVLEGHIPLLSKPFTIAELAQTVREVLDGE